MEFVADFTGSENVKVEPCAGLDKTGWIVRKEVGYNGGEDIAELRLFKNWKLKTKFRFTLKNPAIAQQRRFLEKKMLEHQ